MQGEFCKEIQGFFATLRMTVAEEGSYDGNGGKRIMTVVERRELWRDR